MLLDLLFFVGKFAAGTFAYVIIVMYAFVFLGGSNSFDDLPSWAAIIIGVIFLASYIFFMLRVVFGVV